MKKYLLIIVLVVMFFMSGCGQEEYPDEPGEIGASGSDSGIAAGQAYASYSQYGFAPPIDVFNSNQLVFEIDPNVHYIEIGTEDDLIDIQINVDQDDGLIYKYGYYFSKDGNWRQFEFPQTTAAGTNWIKNKGSVELSLNKEVFDIGKNFIVAYSCEKYEGEWKCGCSSKSGRCNQWMLQEFLLNNVEYPPEPDSPGEIVFTRISTGGYDGNLHSVEKFKLYASLDSIKDISSQLQNPRFTLTDDNGNVTTISELEGGEVNCYESDSNFFCNTYYTAFFTPEEDNGEYILEFTTDNLENSKQIYVPTIYIDSTTFDGAPSSDIGGWDYVSSNAFRNFERDVAIDQKIQIYNTDNNWAYAYQRNYNLHDLKDEISDVFELVQTNGGVVYESYSKYSSIYSSYNYEYYNWKWESDEKIIQLSVSIQDLTESSAVELLNKYLELFPSDLVITEPSIDSVEDSVLVASSGNNFNIGESIGDLETTLDDNDLPNLLADGVFEESLGNINNQEDYTQELKFISGYGNGRIIVEQKDDDAPEGGLYLYFGNSNDNFMYTYILEFDNGVEYDNSSELNANEDLMGSELIIQGVKYTIESVKLSATTLDVIEISDGTNSIKLQDFNKVEVNGKDIDGSQATFESDNGDLVTISISYTPEDKIYLAAGESIVDPIFGSFEILFTENNSNYEDLEFDVSSDDLTLTFNNQDGDEIELPFFCNGTCDNVEHDAIFFGKGTDANERYYFKDGECVGLTSVTDCEGAKFLVKYGDSLRIIEIVDIDLNDNRTTLSDLISTISTTSIKKITGDSQDFNLIDLSFQVGLVIDPENKKVIFVGDDIIGVGQEFETENELLISINGMSDNGINLVDETSNNKMFINFNEAEGEVDSTSDTNGDSRTNFEFNLVIDPVDEEINILTPVFTKATFVGQDLSESNDNDKLFYSDYGTKILYDGEDNRYATISFLKKELEVLVYVQKT